MKMSDVFDLPVCCSIVDNSIGGECVVFDCEWDSSITENQAVAIDVAINNHDKLVEMLQELYYACKNNTGAHLSVDCYEYSLDRVGALLKELEK